MPAIRTFKDKEYRIRQFIFRWAISLPGLGAQIIFGWLPLVIAVVISFQTFNFRQSTWCGTDNYKSILSDPTTTPFSLQMAKENYAGSIKEYKKTNVLEPNPVLKAGYRMRAFYYGLGLVWRNTIYYAFLVLGLTFFIPIIAAILLMEMPPWLIRIMMLMWFVPIASMASIILLKYFYNVDYGLLNGLLAKFYHFIGKPEAEWVFPRYLNSPDIAMLCLVLPNLIMYVPGLIYITALQGIPQDLYDAAEIDGCNFFQKIWNVTLPRLRPIIVTMLIFNVIFAFQVMNEVMIMTQGGPGNATMVMGYYIYKLSFEYLEIGRANALAVFFCLFLMTLTVLQRIFIKDDSDHGTSKKTLKLMEEDSE